MTFVATGWAESLKALLFLTATVAVAGMAGGRLLGLAGMDSPALRRDEKNIFSIAFGFIVLSLGVLFLGLTGQLSYVPVKVWFLVMAAFGWLCPGPNLFRVSASRPSWLTWLATAVFILSAVQALAPPIGNDALAYHLDHPKEFILAGKIFAVPFARESLWPYQTEMLFTYGLLLQGTSLAQLLHWIFFPLTAWAIHSFAVRFYTVRIARWAAAAFLLCPMVFAQSSEAYVDLSLAFFTFLAVYAFTIQKEIGEERAAGLSALAAGGAVATKYLGLGAAGILLLLWWAAARRKARTAGLFFAGSFLVAGIWYLKSWVLIGNPVYPFFPGVFGSGLDFDISEGAGVGKGFWPFVAFAWNFTMKPALFGSEQIGPVFLLFLPFLALNFRKPRPAAVAMTFFTFLYTLFLFKQSQYARFYISVVPFLAVGAGVAFERIRIKKSLLSAVASAVAVCVLAGHLGIYAYRSRHAWNVASGKESADAYLTRFERSYQGYRFLKENVMPGQSVFNSGEIRHFYCETPQTVMNTFMFREALKERGIAVEDCLEMQRFDYVWLQRESDLLEGFLKKGYREVFAYDFEESPGKWSYLILKSPEAG